MGLDVVAAGTVIIDDAVAIIILPVTDLDTPLQGSRITDELLPAQITFEDTAALTAVVSNHALVTQSRDIIDLPIAIVVKTIADLNARSSLVRCTDLVAVVVADDSTCPLAHARTVRRTFLSDATDPLVGPTVAIVVRAVTPFQMSDRARPSRWG